MWQREKGMTCKFSSWIAKALIIKKYIYKKILMCF